MPHVLWRSVTREETLKTQMDRSDLSWGCQPGCHLNRLKLTQWGHEQSDHGQDWRLCKDPTISVDKAFWTFVPSTSHTGRKHSINVTIYFIRQTARKLYCKYLNIQSIGREPQMSQLLYSVHCKARRNFPLHFLLPQSIPKEWLKHRKISLCPPSLVSNDHFSHEGACSDKETHWQENVMFHIHASALLQMLSWHHHIVCD